MVKLLQPMPTLMLRAALRLGMRERVLRLHEPGPESERLNVARFPPALEGARPVPSCAAYPSRGHNARILPLNSPLTCPRSN
jgi:hypothetical protein